MAQTLRKTFTYKSHASLKAGGRRAWLTPLSADLMFVELRKYIHAAQSELLQPRQQVIDRLLREALS